MLKIIILLAFSIIVIDARKHHLEIRNDIRQYISLSSFGFYKNAHLIVKISEFRLVHGQENKIFGLSLDKTVSDAMRQNTDLHQDRCFLDEKNLMMPISEPTLFFVMNFKKEKVLVNCSRNWQNMNIYEEFKNLHYDPVVNNNGTIECNINPLSLKITKTDDTYKYYEFKFVMFVNEGDEGLYNLYFHACPNYDPDPRNTYMLNFNVDIEEMNYKNYLSATEIPLPILYFMMSILYFLSGLCWIYVLRRSKHPVFKIHYLMGVLVFLKSLNLMFHSINFHFIEIKGEHVETWAILYYITHLLKGACLFITIVLIGTGWTFIKHILSDKDKKIFMIVIPLQVLANIAEIILEESEQGSLEHSTWRDIFILVDLLCCAAILFPVVWSIRHLQEASATDGKAATNLRKLKLFRQFYIMIVCYIYFTRIIVFLLKITVPFQYAWLDELFREMATYAFYVLTGYKFRPITQSPYFNIRDLDDEDEVEILTQTGLTENISKVTNRTLGTTSVESYNEDEKENLISKRESSHEYD
ncbi:hypothetical protein PVAND_006561 [Polypedilum vanderplanki]|uniref:GOST seven transmembrane domain-containing protein n=1 Tax=Polypedilum vanderplanki TaxID=319348 RepID=A0A9J6C4H4_POLVA|nr:hypothetical protein PVAND_006561 [Polypedilum vanderplanki]